MTTNSLIIRSIILLILLHFQLLSFSQHEYIIPEFGNDGFVRTDFGMFDFSKEHDFASKLLIAPSNKIIIAGRTTRAGELSHFCIGYYEAEGQLDQTKINGGRVIQPLTVNKDITTTALLDPNGKVLVGGYILRELVNEQPMIARFNPNGSLDTTFNGKGGYGYFIYGDIQRLSHLEWGENGKIVGLGYSTGGPWPGDLDPFMIRLLPDGKWDTQFHNTGKVQFQFSLSDERVYHGAKLEDGNFVMCGSSKASNAKENFWVGKVSADGTIDESFANKGMFLNGNPNIRQQFNTIMELPDKNIIAGGYEYENGISTMVLVKLNSAGKVAQSFGTSGYWRYKFQNKSSEIQSLLFHENQIYVAGNSGGKVCLIRLNSNGQIDTSFGNNGGIYVADETKMDNCTEIKLHEDNILVVGEVEFDFAMCKVMLLPSLHIQNTSVNSDYRIYPNPLKGRAQIEIKSDINQKVSIQILDNQGRLVKTLFDHYQIQSGTQNLEIDLENLISGTYFLQFLNPSKQTIEKIMICR